MKNTEPIAFAFPIPDYCDGLTERKYAAIHLMAAWISDGQDFDINLVVDRVVILAEKLLERLEK